MSYLDTSNKLSLEKGVEHSTMMERPACGIKGEFIGMFFAKEDALIIKVSSDRVNELIAQGKAREFKFTKKRFKEWALIPLELENEYEAYLREAIQYAKGKLNL